MSKLEKPIRISSMLPKFSREMTKHWWMCPKRCDIEFTVFLSEKLFVKIIEVIEDMSDASIVCNTLIHRLSIRLPINITRGRPLHLMHEIVSRIRFNSSLDIISLRNMFWFGLQEMRETGKKYNRYTQFACYCLNAAVNMCSDPRLAVHWHRRQMKHLWKALVSVTFIDDFLLVSTLCQYHQQSRCPFDMVLVEPIQLILEDAPLSDGMWNETKLMVISHHQHLFFDFPTIINFAMHKASAFGIAQFLDFIHSQQLMNWPQMERVTRDMLVRSNNPILHAINVYIHRQMMDDFTTSNAVFPLPIFE